MHRLEHIAQGLLKPMNPYASLLLGLLTLSWGVWIINPFWSVFGTAQVYTRAAQFAPEWAWGTWATICGISILYGIYKGSARWLASSLGFAMWHWFTVAGMLWWGDWQNTSGITYTFIGCYTIFAYLNLKVNFIGQGIKHI